MAVAGTENGTDFGVTDQPETAGIAAEERTEGGFEIVAETGLAAAVGPESEHLEMGLDTGLVVGPQAST